MEEKVIQLSVVPPTAQQQRIDEATSKEDNTKWTPEDMLKRALQDFAAGKWKGNKAIVVILDTEGGRHTDYRCNVNDLEFWGICARSLTI